jgi:hypothetical protein
MHFTGSIHDFPFSISMAFTGQTREQSPQPEQRSGSTQ